MASKSATTLRFLLSDRPALQKNPGVGGDRAPGKVGFYAAVASEHLTCELGCITDCIHRGNALSYFNN